MTRIIVFLTVLVMFGALPGAALAEQQPKAKPTGAKSGSPTFQSVVGLVESIQGGDPIRFTVRVLSAPDPVRALERAGRLTVALHPATMRRIQEKKLTFDVKPGDRVKIRGFIQDGVFLVKRVSSQRSK